MSLGMNYITKDRTQKEDELFYDALLRYIIKKRSEFFLLYGVYPKYIKVYSGFTERIKERFSEIMKPSNSTVFMRMQICETPKVSSIYDIEVF